MSNKTMENVKTINNAVRTMVMLGFLGGFGYLGWLGYDHWIKPGLEAEQVRQDLAELKVRFDEQKEQLIKTQTALKLLKVDHRKAVIKIVEQGVEEESKDPFFVVQFTEIDPEGHEISKPREFRLRGTLMFVDSWVVKFDDKYVQEADALRSASLCVFKSIYGDGDGRNGGHSLDQKGSDINTAYGTLDPKNEFEQQIWDDFWALANDPKRQQELGIRGSHGTVSYIQVMPGMVYHLDLRASDGITLKSVMNPQNASTSVPSE